MITKQSVIDQLNKLLTLDRDLIEKLLIPQPVSNAYQNADEFVWVFNKDDPNLSPQASFIGVLQGLLNEQDGYYLAANYDTDDNGKITKLIEFLLVEAKNVK